MNAVRDNERVVCRIGLFAISALLMFSYPVFSQPGDDLKPCASAPSVPWTQAQAIQKGTVEIPPLAKAARVQGTVRIEVCISKAGQVVLTKPISGNPILIPAAIESAKKWRFKMDGTAPFKTVLEILFSQGGTAVEIADEAKVNDRFFEEDRKCREDYRSKKFDEALVLCKGVCDVEVTIRKVSFFVALNLA